MDLSRYDVVQEGVSLHVRSPEDGSLLYDDNDPKQPMCLLLLSADSSVVRAASRQEANMRIQNQRVTMTVEEAEEKALGILVKATVGITGKWVVDDNEVKYSPEAMKTLYSRFPWLRKQADEFVSTQANFLKASSRK